MRDIKFRAWDYQNNKWATDNDVVGSVGLEFGIKDYFMNIAGERAIRFTFLQYTGLKDKNGVEIYEGDVVKDEATVFKVIWYKGRFDFERVSGVYQFPYFGDNCSRMEIVGNIYEHHVLTI